MADDRSYAGFWCPISQPTTESPTVTFHGILHARICVRRLGSRTDEKWDTTGVQRLTVSRVRRRGQRAVCGALTAAVGAEAEWTGIECTDQLNGGPRLRD